MTDDLVDVHLERSRRTIDGGSEIVILIDRPEKLNALPAATTEALAAQFEGIDQTDGDIVTVRGQGDDFCVGADLGEMDAISAEESVESAARLHRLVDAMRSCPLPILAAVQGRAFGAGFILCMAADVVVAEEDAEFGLQEVTLGIPVGGYSTELLPMIVGEKRAREWLLTGSVVSAVDADIAGFVTQVAPPNEFAATVSSYTDSLASNSASAIELLKAQLTNSGRRRNPSEVRASETSAIRTAFTEGDAGERIQKFLTSE